MCTGSLVSMKNVSLVFTVLYLAFLRPISRLLRCNSRPSFVKVVVVIVTLSTFLYVPFTCLHFGGQPVGFITVGFISVVTGVILGLFFLLLYP